MKSFYTNNETYFNWVKFDESSKHAGKITPGRKYTTGAPYEYKEINPGEFHVNYDDYTPREAAFKAYRSWYDRLLKNRNDHAEYVKLKSETPGRDATILTTNETASLLSK